MWRALIACTCACASPPAAPRAPAPVADAGPEASTGQLRGTVVNRAHAPAAGAAVVVSGPGLERTVNAGADGRFAIGELPPGRYTVSIDHGQAQVRYEVLICGDRVTTLPARVPRPGTAVVVVDQMYGCD